MHLGVRILGLDGELIGGNLHPQWYFLGGNAQELGYAIRLNDLVRHAKLLHYEAAIFNAMGAFKFGNIINS